MKGRRRRGRAGYGPESWTLPAALGVLFVVLLAWYMVYTGQIVRYQQTVAETFTRIYGEVQTGLTSPEPEAALAALTSLQGERVQLACPRRNLRTRTHLPHPRQPPLRRRGSAHARGGGTHTALRG